MYVDKWRLLPAAASDEAGGHKLTCWRLAHVVDCGLTDCNSQSSLQLPLYLSSLRPLLPFTCLGSPYLPYP